MTPLFLIATLNYFWMASVQFRKLLDLRTGREFTEFLIYALVALCFASTTRDRFIKRRSNGKPRSD